MGRIVNLASPKASLYAVPAQKDLKQARALLTDPEITVEDVARRLGVGPSTLYRYLPAARQSVQGDGG